MSWWSRICRAWCIQPNCSRGFFRYCSFTCGPWISTVIAWKQLDGLHNAAICKDEEAISWTLWSQKVWLLVHYLWAICFVYNFRYIHLFNMGKKFLTIIKIFKLFLVAQAYLHVCSLSLVGHLVLWFEF